MKIKMLVLLLLGCTVVAQAQSAKKITPPSNRSFSPEETAARNPLPAVPAATQSFGLPVPALQPISAFVPGLGNAVGVKTILGENGLPIFFETNTPQPIDANRQSPSENALRFWAQLQPKAIQDPINEFVVKAVQTDEQGNFHVRMQQVYQSVPVYGAEVVAHSQNGQWIRITGRYFPSTIGLSTTPKVSADAAYAAVLSDFGADHLKTRWSDEELRLIGGQLNKSELVVFYPQEDGKKPRLAWHIVAHPNMLKRLVYVIDAENGAILTHFDHTCQIDGGRLQASAKTREAVKTSTQNIESTELTLVGPVNASGVDLLNVNRNFGAWQVSGNQIVLEDASKSMFNAAQSVMPNDPVGAIVTLTALGTSPEVQSSFNYDFISSGSTTFNNPTGVSAHYNAGKSFDYYKTTFNRNSIDGTGGNILSFVEVSDNDGSSMENAYWNGAAMWYGNGGTFFKRLARGLDVGGHEMTHGVIEKTANLEYQGESGAMNESFADVFGAMIDRDDWKIGEDVMQAGVNPSGCLRDLSNPNNGVNSSSPWWQPKQLSERYTGNDDNGGVHINSGICNRAYYLFATNAAVGKDKAEQVYYKALRDYLVKSSKFIDLRIAVMQAATDLYGSAVSQAAAAAFDAVGILGNQPAGNYLGQLNKNPGDEYVLCVSDDGINLDLALGNGQYLGSIFTQGVESKPSITDDGRFIVFVSAAGHIVTVGMNYTQTQIIPILNGNFSANPIWRNAVVSKDGRFIAGLTQNQDNRVYIFDLADPNLNLPQTFTLYNPTYSQTPTITGEVQYADVLEFDYSGAYLMYDAFNKLSNSSGEDISYWDIGFLKFWNNGQFVSGAPFISKLFSGLPENTSVGDPTFAKNSPYIIAFDVFDSASNLYDVYGANTETGDYGPIVSNNGALGWPSYNLSDNKILFESESVSGVNLYTQGLKTSKIEPQGNEAGLLSAHQYGTYYGDGIRSLAVGTQAPLSFINQMSVWPNPSAGVAQLRLNSKEALTARLELCNMFGVSVFEKTIQLAPGENQIGLDMQPFSAGAYVLRLISGNQIQTLRLIRS